jgi:hypothetical protein
MPVTFRVRISKDHFLDALAWYLFSRNGPPVDPSPILLVSFRVRTTLVRHAIFRPRLGFGSLRPVQPGLRTRVRADSPLSEGFTTAPTRRRIGG